MSAIIANVKVKDLQFNTTVDCYFLIKLLSEKESTNKKTYLDFILKDSTGEVDAKLWNKSKVDLPNGIEIGSIIKVRAFVSEFNKTKQLKISQIRRITDKDNINKEDFIKSAPLPPEEMYQYILNVAYSISINDLKKICVTFLERTKEKLMYFPAAMIVHHAEKGGLLYHIYRMLKSAEALYPIYGFNLGLLQAGIIMHDNGKLDELNSNLNGIVEDYTKEGKTLGHIALGLRRVALLSYELNINSEVEMLLEHFIVSHHYDETKSSFVKPAFYEAQLLHEFDSRDAVNDIFKAGTASVEPGDFSSKQFYLQNRQIYVPDLNNQSSTDNKNSSVI